MHLYAQSMQKYARCVSMIFICNICKNMHSPLCWCRPRRLLADSEGSNRAPRRIAARAACRAAIFKVSEEAPGPKGSTDLSAEHSMRISVGCCGPAYGQARWWRGSCAVGEPENCSQAGNHGAVQGSRCKLQVSFPNKFWISNLRLFKMWKVLHFRPENIPVAPGAAALAWLGPMTVTVALTQY